MIRSRRRKPRPGRLDKKGLETLRLTCFERDGGRCQQCGCFLLYRRRYELDPIAFEMAHLRGKRMWGDSLENVRSLCFTCHKDEHQPKACPPKVAA